MSRGRAIKNFAKMLSKRTSIPKPNAKRLKGPATSMKMMLHGSRGAKHREDYVQKTVAAYEKRVGKTKQGLRKQATHDFEVRQYNRVRKVIGEREQAFRKFSAMPRIGALVPKGMIPHLSKDPIPSAMANKRKALLNKARGVSTRKGIRFPIRKRRR